jgi:hypothetical protein
VQRPSTHAVFVLFLLLAVVAPGRSASQMPPARRLPYLDRVGVAEGERRLLLQRAGQVSYSLHGLRDLEIIAHSMENLAGRFSRFSGPPAPGWGTFHAHYTRALFAVPAVIRRHRDLMRAGDRNAVVTIPRDVDGLFLLAEQESVRVAGRTGSRLPPLRISHNVKATRLGVSLRYPERTGALALSSVRVSRSSRSRAL